MARQAARLPAENFKGAAMKKPTRARGMGGGQGKRIWTKLRNHEDTKRLSFFSSVFYEIELVPCEVLPDHDIQ
jgi:hypothetical protein